MYAINKINIRDSISAYPETGFKKAVKQALKLQESEKVEPGYRWFRIEIQTKNRKVWEGDCKC